MQPNTTDTLRSVLDQAQAEATLRNHEFIGTDHLLLAVLNNSTGQACRALKLAHVNVDSLKAAIKSQLQKDAKPSKVSGPLPMSPKAQAAFNASIVMAQSLRESKVSTRHFLLGLINEPSPEFQSAIQRIGGDIEALRQSLGQKPADAEV